MVGVVEREVVVRVGRGFADVHPGAWIERPITRVGATAGARGGIERELYG
jgi:hypothetical protein